MGIEIIVGAAALLLFLLSRKGGAAVTSTGLDISKVQSRFLASQTAAREGIDNTPQSQEIVDNLIRLQYYVGRIEERLKLFGLIDNRVIITSGYRCPELNVAVGGSKTGDHPRGLACDIGISGDAKEAYYTYIRSMGEGGELPLKQLIIYDWQGCIHFAIRPEGVTGIPSYLRSPKQGSYIKEA